MVLVVVDRARVLGAFGLRYTDEDQSVLWLTAQDLNHGRVFAPYFYGQSYAGWIESLVAVPLLAAGVALRTALPLAGCFVAATPCLLLAAAAWRRRSPLTAMAVLCGFVLLSTDAVVTSSMPRGLSGGILVAAIGVVLILGRGEPRPWAVVGFSLLAVVGASLNQTSLLLTAPAGAYLLLRQPKGERSGRVWFWGAMGAGTGVVLHGLAQSFYDNRPSYRFHRLWPLRVHAKVLGRSLHHLGDYFGAYAPDAVRSPALPLLALAICLGLLVVKRGLPGLGAALVSVAAIVVSLATPKATDGSASVFLPYSRFYLVFPVLLAYLVVQAGSEERVRPWVTRVVATSLLVVAVAGYASRQSHLPGEVAHLVDGQLTAGPVRAGSPNPGGARTAAVRARCREAEEVARRLDVKLIVYTEDRLASYLCGAELYGQLLTLYPPYERRTWVLVDESTRLRTAMLVADVDASLCDRARSVVTSCTYVSEPLGMAVLRFPPQPVLNLVRRLGIEVRPF